MCGIFIRRQPTFNWNRCRSIREIWHGFIQFNRNN